MSVRGTYQQARDTTRLANLCLQLVQRGLAKAAAQVKGNDSQPLSAGLKN